MGQETWGDRAQELRGGMVPCFGGHLVPAVEVGKTVSPAAAEAMEEGCKVASTDGNSYFTGGWTNRQNRRLKQELARVEAMFNTTSVLLGNKCFPSSLSTTMDTSVIFELLRRRNVKVIWFVSLE